MRRVTAVSRAIAILRFVADSDEPVAIGAMAAVLRIPRNTTYELVHTLEEEHLVRLTPEGRLVLGVRTFEFGARYAQSIDLLAEGRDVVTRLRDQSRETVHLAVLDGRDAVYLDKRESLQIVRMSTAPGYRLPAHLAAVGKAMLAALSPEEVHARLDGVSLEAMTSNSITNLGMLMRDLDETRRRGYAVDDQESSVDVACVGAAVRGPDGGLVAGLSISAPAMRVNKTRRRELSGLVVAAAAEISERLGHHMPAVQTRS